MARQVGVRIVDVRSLQRDLRAVSVELPRELRKGFKEVAEIVADRARSLLSGMGAAAAQVAPSVRAAAEQRAAKIAWGGARYPFAAGTVMGAYHDVPRNTARGTVMGWNQFPEWVGDSWQVGARGSGPRGINDAVADTEREVLEALGDFLESIVEDHIGHGRDAPTLVSMAT